MQILSEESSKLSLIHLDTKETHIDNIYDATATQQTQLDLHCSI